MDTLDFIREALQSECGISPDLIHNETNLLHDLELDSLDLLNASFVIEKLTGVKLPVETWIQEEYGDQVPEVSRFSVASIRGYMENRVNGH